MHSKCFQRNVFFWLFCQLLDHMWPQSIPKLALIPAAFNRALWPFHPLLSLAGQNHSSMGCLTAGMLSFQFPPPRQNCDLLGASFSVVWPLTQEPVPWSSFLRLTSLLYWSCVVPDLHLRWLRVTSVEYSRRFSHNSGMFLYPSVFAFLICAEKFPVFVWGLEVQLICICPLSDIFISAVRRLWESSFQSRRWSVEYVKTKQLSLFIFSCFSSTALDTMCQNVKAFTDSVWLISGVIECRNYCIGSCRFPLTRLL